MTRRSRAEVGCPSSATNGGNRCAHSVTRLRGALVDSVPTATGSAAGASRPGSVGSCPPPGAVPQFGQGTAKVFRYTVEVENGMDTTTFGGDDAFVRMVDETLANPKSWT